jgi:hypothetical protein
MKGIVSLQDYDTTSTKQPTSSRYTAKKAFILAFIVALVCSVVSYTRVLNELTSSSMHLRDEVTFNSRPPPTSAQRYRNGNQYPMDEADFIIQQSYSETYARMATAPCKDSDVEAQCIRIVADYLDEQKRRLVNATTANSDTTILSSYKPLPWWFQTLLRDIPVNGAYGFWHHFSTNATSPPLKFCAIGKNGSTEWRKIFKALNAPEFGGVENSKFNTKVPMSDDMSVTPHTVFLRDPLERLLSGYLDKCVKDAVRKSQGHCEPNSIFGVDYLERKATKQQKENGEDVSVDIAPSLLDMDGWFDKEKFATYVDLLPLKWNVHFVPQSIFCDLYRTIETYDKYLMGKEFMPELDRMAKRYGGLLPEVLDDIFNYQTQLSDARDEAEKNVGASNAHGTRAPSKVAQYYSARAIRRALEYLSIDYVTLGLDVPDWAREMLRNDV